MRKILASTALAVSLLSVPVLAQTHSTVRSVQQALKDKGLDPGPVDGIRGPKTRAAIKQFQTQQNLDENGRLGPKTLDALGVKTANPKTSFKASGENVKNSYGSGGKTVADGSRQMASDVKDGHVGAGASSFGKGVGKGVAKMGVGTGHAAKNVAKGVKNSLTGGDKKTTQP